MEHTYSPEFVCYPCTRVHGYQGEDTCHLTPAASQRQRGQRTSIYGMRTPSWNEWAACKGRPSCSWKFGKTASLVKETKQQSQPLGRPYSNLVDMRRQVQPCIKCHTQDNGRYRPTGLAPRTAVLVGVWGNVFRPVWRSSWSCQDKDDDLPFSQPPL
jgi:hypothetical protein